VAEATIAHATEERTGVDSSRHRCSGNTNLNVQKGAREATSLKKNTTVPWPRRGRRGLRRHYCSIFRRLLQSAYRTYWVRELQQPRSSLRPGPKGSIGQDYKTRNELKGGRTQGGELRVRGRRRHRTQNSAGRGRGEDTAKRSGRSPATPTQGRLRGVKRGFSPSGFPLTWRTSVPHITLAFIPTAGGEASEAVAKPQIGAAGGAAASLSQGGLLEGYENRVGAPRYGVDVSFPEGPVDFPLPRDNFRTRRT